MRGVHRIAAAASIFLLAGTASAAAVSEPAGTVVVPPNPSYQGTTVWTFNADQQGLTYMVQAPGGGSYVTYHRNPADQAPVVLDGQSVRPGMESVVNGVAALPQADANSGQITSVILKPLAGGATTTLPVNQYEYYIGSTGSGIIVGRNLQSGDYGVDILLRRAGQADATIDHTANDTSPHGLVDQSGMVLNIGGTVLKYYDFTANTSTVLNTDPSDVAPWLAFLTPTLIGWRGGNANNTMVWVGRGGGAQHRLLVPFTGITADSFAVSGATVAWTTYSNFQYALYEQPADGSGSATQVMSTLTSAAVLTEASGSFAVIARPTPSTFGIYQVTPAGQNSLLQPIASDWAPIEQLALSGNRVMFSDASEQASPIYGLPYTRAGTTLTLGTETRLGANVADDRPDGASPDLVTSDGRTAYATTNNTIVVLDEGTLQRTITSTTYAARVSQLSGDHLLYSANGALQVMDVVAGTMIPAPSAATLWGRYMYYQGAQAGQILRRDWNAPLSATNPKQVRASDGCVIAFMQVWGNWVKLECGMHGTNVYELWNMKTAATLPITQDQATKGQLGDGMLLYPVYDGNSSFWISSMDLTQTNHPVTEIGDLPNVFPGQTYALNSAGAQSVAWEHPDGRIHLAPLSEPASNPSVFDKQTPHTVKAGAQWVAAWDISKPVSWTLTIKNSAAVIVRGLNGTAGDGSIRLTWDRKNGSGTAVPTGTYNWTLTAPGLDGRGTVTQSGTVTLK